MPDGAPPARDEQGNLVAVPEGADDVAPEHDEKYRYIFNNWPRLEKVKRFILATDGDEPGWRLAQELARRLGRARCAFVTYPQGCKDLNEALEKYGERGVAACFSRAKPFPVKGLYKLSEFPDAGAIRTYSTGFGALDPSTRPKRPVHAALSGLLHDRLRPARRRQDGLDDAARLQHGPAAWLASRHRVLRDAGHADAAGHAARLLHRRDARPVPKPERHP